MEESEKDSGKSLEENCENNSNYGGEENLDQISNSGSQEDSGKNCQVEDEKMLDEDVEQEEEVEEEEEEEVDVDVDVDEDHDEESEEEDERDEDGHATENEDEELIEDEQEYSDEEENDEKIEGSPGEEGRDEREDSDGKSLIEDEEEEDIEAEVEEEEEDECEVGQEDKEEEEEEEEEDEECDDEAGQEEEEEEEEEEEMEWDEEEEEINGKGNGEEKANNDKEKEVKDISFEEEETHSQQEDEKSSVRRKGIKSNNIEQDQGVTDDEGDITPVQTHNTPAKHTDTKLVESNKCSEELDLEEEGNHCKDSVETTECADNIVEAQKEKALPEDEETEPVEVEDYPTDKLLKELHYLNASCEKPSISTTSMTEVQKVLKKQRKLEFTPSKTEEVEVEVEVGEQENEEESVTRRVSKRKRKTINYSLKKRKKNPPAAKPQQQEPQSSNQPDNNLEEIVACGSDDEGCGLTIVAQEEEPRKRKPSSSPRKPKKKLKVDDEGDVPQEVIELIQSGIDEVLEEKAERTRLTANHVKNIIKNVMTDENVLAMVRNTVLGMHETDSPVVYEPTLTRAKTKELMMQKGPISTVNIWAGLSNSADRVKPAVYHETRALATTEFPEEDEDEEYRPEADEQLHSDDESFVSTTGFGSDMGSPCTPSTPQSQFTPGSRSCLNTPASSMSTPLDKHMHLPKEPTLQQKAVQRALDFDNFSKKELVSQRTRSKLPLTETPLECLEMAFKPPDVTKDMYDTVVNDEEWKSFLIDFIHPLENVECNEDEEADPEYNILEDKEDEIDLREEMRGDRAVQISKKEINELMTELLDTLVDNGKTANVRAHLSQQFRKDKKYEITTPKLKGGKDALGMPAPGEIWVEVITAKFTPKQLETLQCQMVQHVQLLTSSWLMCSGYSAMDEAAEGYLSMLKEIQKSKEGSAFSETYFQTRNFDAALNTIQSAKEKAEKQNLADQERKKLTELSKHVIGCILESEAFPYPKLLPTRMFHIHGPSSKAKFVPAEDALIAMGLERYLDPEHRTTHISRRSSKMIEAIGHTVKNVLAAKSVDQVFKKITNIRRRAPEEHDFMQNVIYEYLGTGVLNIPEAEPEVALPCVPCAVKDFPDEVLDPLWRKILKDRKRQIAQAKQQEEQQAKERADAERRTLGMTPVQNILIIQSPNGSTQLILPNNLGSVIPQPSIVLSSNNITSTAIQQPPVSTVPAVPVMPLNNQPLLFNVVEDATPTAQSSWGTVECIGVVQPPGLPSAIPYGQPLGLNSASTSTASVTPVDTGVLTQVQTPADSASQILSVLPASDDIVQPRTEDIAQNKIPESQNKVVAEKTQEAENPLDVHDDGDSLPDLAGVGEDTDQEAVDESPALDAVNQGGESPKMAQESFSTPEKLPPSVTKSIPTPLLHMPSLLTTPQKVDEKGPPTVCVSFSPLKTPVITIPSPEKSLATPERTPRELSAQILTLDGQVQSKSHVKSLDSSLSEVSSNASIVNNIPVTDSTKEVNSGPSPSKSVTSDGSIAPGNNPLPESDETPNKMEDSNPEPLNKTPPKTSSITLVTSVYQSPILSSEVHEGGPVAVMNVTPKKSSPPLRRISPAKVLRSPMRTSPMKQVSPILRKYHKYSPKKRRNLPGNKKLSPILPKILPPRKRTLKPKPVGTPSATQETISAKGKSLCSSESQSFLHGVHSGSEGDLVQMDDEMVLDSDTGSEATTEPAGDNTSDTVQSKADEVQQSEEEFEEDYLEEEEEEEGEAAQEREEHLAALLKASSTIAWRRGGCDSSERKLNADAPGARRLNKQQRRLQARITALSNVPDTVSQDKFMAQSYLMRVREALTGKDPSLFKEFLFILNQFTENQTSTPLELYGQLCELLKDFPHLTEEFVSFLLPQQAMAIGKYAQYCAIHRMRDFLEKLELQFRKQPQYIQKIIRMLQSLQNRPELEAEDLKGAMAPLLRYPHLVECFMQCFPSQAPAPSLPGDFEDISLDQPGTPDSVENLILPEDEPNTSPDHCVCPRQSSDTRTPAQHCQSCAMRFSEGRVYLQHGKTLRPARVTYNNMDSKEKIGVSESDRLQGRNAGLPNDVERISTGKNGVNGRFKETGDDGTPKNRGVHQGENGDKFVVNDSDQKEGTEKRKQDDIDASCDETSNKRQETISSRRDRKDSNRDKNEKNDSNSDKTSKTNASRGGVNSSVKSKGSSNVDSAQKTNKKPSFLVCSPPKEVHNENAVLPSCPRTRNIQTFNSVGELLAPHVDEREKNKTNALIEENQVEFIPKSQGGTPDISHGDMSVTRSATPESQFTAGISRTLQLSSLQSTEEEIATSSLPLSSVCLPATEVASSVLAKDLELSSSLSLPAISTTPQTPPWTKEEDMQILTMVQQKGATELTFQELTSQLSWRTYSEVLERFNELIKMMMEDAGLDDTVSLSSEDSYA